jgi:hypothetical protein
VFSPLPMLAMADIIGIVQYAQNGLWHTSRSVLRDAAQPLRARDSALLTETASIVRWWKHVMCAYLFVSLQSPALVSTGVLVDAQECHAPAPAPALQHPAWTDDASGKHRLTNPLSGSSRSNPSVCACLLLPWLRLYPLPHLTAGLADRCALMNTYRPLFPP